MPYPEGQLFVSGKTGIDFAIYQGFHQDKLTDLFVDTRVVLSLEVYKTGKENCPDFSRHLEKYSSNKSKALISLPTLIAELFLQNARLIIDATLRTKAADFLKLGNLRQIKFSTYSYQNNSIVTARTIFISTKSAISSR